MICEEVMKVMVPFRQTILALLLCTIPYINADDFSTLRSQDRLGVQDR